MFTSGITVNVNLHRVTNWHTETGMLVVQLHNLPVNN